MKTKVKIIIQVSLTLFLLESLQLDKFSQNDTLRSVADTINGVYIPVDLDDCFEQINTFWHDTTIIKVRSINENIFLGNTSSRFWNMDKK